MALSDSIVPEAFPRPESLVRGAGPAVASMEDPKTFSAPVTVLNDSSHSDGEEVPTPYHDASSDLGSKTGDADCEQSLDLKKHEKCNVCASCGHLVTKAQDEFRKSILQQGGSRPKDQIKDVDNHGDLEANICKSSDTSDTIVEKDSNGVDPNIVDWDGPEDPTNPMNWPAWKVKAHIFLVSAITFIRYESYWPIKYVRS